MNVHLTDRSDNSKTGPIPVSTTTQASCPTSCPFAQGNGCYFEVGKGAIHWRHVTEGMRGGSWGEFLRKVAAFPALQVWRHNQGGDLPHRGGRIDRTKLHGLALANEGRRGFTYTHHLLGIPGNLETVKLANSMGFTVNASTESERAADRAMQMGVPAVTVAPSNETRRVWTNPESGRRFVRCPATYNATTCSNCGNGRPLCQRADRDYVIVFPAHGIAYRKADARVVRRAPPAR